MKKPLPEFISEEQESEFWANHDSSEYLDWGRAEQVQFPNLKPSRRSISLRLSQSMLNELKQLANEQDVPYQSLIKMILRDRLDRERRNRTRLLEK